MTAAITGGDPTIENQFKQFLSDDESAKAGAPRECGSCTACCTVLAVDELEKKNNVPCCHLAGGEGCSIYTTRPGACRQWSCLWLKGGLKGDVRRRPDHLGLVFSDDVHGPFPMLTAYEVWAGASREPHAKYVLDRLGECCNMVLVDPQNGFVVSSPNARFKAAMTN